MTMENIKGVIVFAVVVLIISGGLLYGTGVLEIGAASQVYVPFYGRLECVATGIEPIRTYDFKGDEENVGHGVVLENKNALSNIDEGEETENTLYCGEASYTNSCQYSYRTYDESNINLCLEDWKVYICPIEFKSLETDCTLVAEPEESATTTGFIAQVGVDVDGDNLITFKDNDAEARVYVVQPTTGDCDKQHLSITESAQKYVLRDVLGNGFTTTYEQGCDLNVISEQAGGSGLHLLEDTDLNTYEGNTQIPFDQDVEYIWGLVPVVTSNVINKAGVSSEDVDRNGVADVYIEQAGYYIPIIRSPDGTYYADTLHPVKDSSIECVPSDVFVCNEDATLREDASTDVSGQSCSILRGVPTNTFIPISGDTTCMFSCEDGSSVQQTCEEIELCNAQFTYDQENNDCVETGTISSYLSGTSFEETLQNAKLIIVILAGIIVAAATIFIAMELGVMPNIAVLLGAILGILGAIVLYMWGL